MHQNRSVVFSGPTAEERTSRSFGRLITRRCCPECLLRCAARDKQGRQFFQRCGDKSVDFVDRGHLMASNDRSLRGEKSHFSATVKQSRGNYSYHRPMCVPIILWTWLSCADLVVEQKWQTSQVANSQLNHCLINTKCTFFQVLILLF